VGAGAGAESGGWGAGADVVLPAAEAGVPWEAAPDLALLRAAGARVAVERVAAARAW
jgi:hypothetical protein